MIPHTLSGEKHLQPESARTAMDNRLLVRPDIWYACFVDRGKFCKEIVALPEVVRVLPDGCMIVFTDTVVASYSAGALSVRREMFAAMSNSVKLFKYGGFSQPGVK